MISDPHQRQLLELTVALEIAKTERDACRAQAELLKSRLQDTTRRAEKAEERLHETTKMLWTLARDAVTAPTKSVATEVMVDGKRVLHLSNPVMRAREDRRAQRKQI
ncbi:MAG: hypothetical protein O2898_00975 [Proteobacteria bacterium]|nr:hypothetical protein [Pseudomonadota bacterium]